MILKHSKRFVSALFLAIVLTLALSWQATAGMPAKRGKVSRPGATAAQVTAGAADTNQLVSDLDAIFAKAKADFDKIASSVLLKYPRIKPVNTLFWKALKAHQPWNSLLRTDKKGVVINEVIRIEGEAKEKRSVAGESWFAEVSKAKKEHLTIIKNEKNGRYYLVWVAPILAKAKGAETFQGAVAANIDLWDCFDRYADKSPSPFKIIILDRVVLYEHLWRDTIKYAGRRLTVPGLDKITVRYPGTAGDAALRAADSAALAQAQQDSLKAKTARDMAASLAAKADAAKKAKSHNTILLTVIIIIVLLIIILVVVMVLRGRKKPEDIGGPEGGNRFGNLG